VRLSGGSARDTRVERDSTWRCDDVPETGTCHFELLETCEADPPSSKTEPPAEATKIAPGGPSVALVTGRKHALVVSVPQVTCVRLFGALFPLGKTFVLPPVLEGIRIARSLYDAMPEATLLAVGHTDTTGDPDQNVSLSLERAKAMIAFLQDDVDAWLAYYDDAVGGSTQWGREEDLAMLSALPYGQPPYYGEHHTEHAFEAAVRRFQDSYGLQVDGKPGSETRRALVTAYMAADETSLPEGVTAVAHGCGESFLEVETPDDTLEPQNRRVDVFLFREAIDPQPRGDTSGADDPSYRTWREKVEDERTFTPTDDGLGTVVIATDIELEHAEIAGVSFVLKSSDGSFERTLLPHEDGHEAYGYVDLHFEGVPRTGFYSLSLVYADGSEEAVFEDLPYHELAKLGTADDSELKDPFAHTEDA